MMEIVRGRKWEQHFSVLDSVDGPGADLSDITNWKSQIRKKIAVRNEKGDFENALVADVLVNVTGSRIRLHLPQNITSILPLGDHQIDLVGSNNIRDEAFLLPEPIKVVDRPTHLS
jgi:hypothetical protein